MGALDLVHAGEVVLLAAFAPVAFPCDGSLSGAAVGGDGKVRARAACGGGVCVERVMADRAGVRCYFG
jgi:hypothetical protein